MERYIEIKYKPTEEQINFFYERTHNHIRLVNKYLSEIDVHSYLYNYYHDNSKFQYPEYIPYIHLTWQKKCEKENVNYNISEDLQNEIYNATLHHVNTNEHHPEFWDPNKWNVDFINKQDRDKPSKYLVDATSMGKNSIMEMCADWCAMSEELGESSPLNWAKKNINIRWKFTKEQEYLIYKILNKVWK